MTTKTNTLQQTAIDTVRILAVDAVQKANSGHPGMPMGAAPMGHVLWHESMNIIRKILNGQTVTGLFFCGPWHACYNIVFFI